LHVCGTRRLFTCGRDLFGKIGGRVNVLRRFNIEPGKENYLKPVAHRGIVFDEGGNGVDQLDNQLRHEISGRCFTTDHERARRKVRLRIVFQTQIERENVQHTEVLTFVLVDTLDQNIEERFRVQFHANPLSNESHQALFGAEFHLAPLRLEVRVICEASKPRSSCRSRSQPSPILLMMSCVSLGLLMATKRRGLTPLVTLQNFSGHSSAKSRKTTFLCKLEWSWATPFTR